MRFKVLLLWGSCALAACSGATDGSGDDDDAGGDGGGSAQGGEGGEGVPPDGEPRAAEVGQEFRCRGGKQSPGPSLVRRLTTAEYLASVRDLTGVELGDKARLIPREARHDGFTNDAKAQIVTLDHVETFAALADEVLLKLVDKKGFIARHASCTQMTDECKRGFVDTLGKRIFRRPLDDGDRAALLPLFAAAVAEGGTFDAGAELVLSAMLQSPRFLYLIESQAGSEAVRDLDGYELASRLSYLFWGSTPDDGLLTAAGDGSLNDEEGLRETVKRLLQSPRARQRSLMFVDNWLHLDRLEELQTPVAADMKAETEALFSNLVWEDGAGMAALFDAPFTFASKALAQHYQLSGARDGVQRYDLANVPNRRGLVTQGSVLSAGGESGSLVNRGLFILRNFLCSEVPPPPIGVNNGRPDTQPGKPQRYYAEQRASTSPCSNCHSHLDPLAFAFEGFSGVGVARDKDESGNELVTNGTLITPYDEEGKTFENAEDFARLLAADERARDCMVLKPVQFALGRALDEADACTLEAIRKAAEGEPKYADVLETLVVQRGYRTIATDNP
jgi:hypothetical protein